MQTSFFKTILAAGISLFIISCNNSKKDKVKVTEIKLTDIRQEEEEDPEPPPPPPPKASMPSETDICFASDGLKYKTVVTISFGIKNEVSGNVTSEELDSGKKETATFSGTSDGMTFKVKFKGTAPVVGAASEWTDKPWTIEQLEGKGQWMRKLHIIFNAKNYETNKWEATDYSFMEVACK